MGDGCCSGAGHDGPPTPGPSSTAQAQSHRQGDGDQGHEHEHADDHGHGGCCGDEEDACQGEDYCDEDHSDASSHRSSTLKCCDSDEEHCDEKCIIAAAAIECEKMCEGDLASESAATGHEHTHDDQGHHPSSACKTHLAKAFDQYSAYLETARCICRSILDRGWTTSCCDSQPKKAAVSRTDTTTAYSTSRQGPKAKHHHHGIKRRGKNAHAHAHGNMAHHHDHGHGDDDYDHGHGHGDESDCCSGHDEKISFDEKVPGTTAMVTDVEKAQGVESVTLSVEGMTCSGCGNKMEKTLKSIPGVSSVSVNFVMGHAEFSVNTAVNTPDEVIRAAERATSFKCTKLASDDQAVDVVASGASAKALLDLDLPGLNSASIVNKKTVRLTYDPLVIGARTLVEKVRPLSEGLAPPRDDPSVSSGRKRLYDQLYKTIVAACLTIPVVTMAWGDNLVGEPTRAIVSFVLATLVQLIAVPDFYKPALSALIHSRTIEMDMLVVISITAAYLYSLVAFGFRLAGKPLETSEFFETSTLLITLVILGRLVAAFARVRAVAAVSLRSLQTTSATIVEKDGDVDIDARVLQYGDKFKVGPHSVVPTDGIVLNGSSDLDESMLTGESLPVFKKQGDPLIAGTVNGTGTLVVRLTRLPGKNTVTDIAQLVEEAQNSKPRIQDYADKVASWFVPVVTTVAVIVVIVWVVVGLKVRNYGTGQAIANAITYAVSTLAVSCPCALGLAVPMVLVVAGGIAARGGVIIKSAESTERARKVTDIVFDKTGTITEGDLDVMEEKFYGLDEADAIAISKALVAGNKHPVSLAVSKHLEKRDTAAASLDAVHVIPGAGVEAKFDGAELRAGHPKWTGTLEEPTVKGFLSDGMTLLVITRNSSPVAVYGLRTRLRREAAKVVSQLGRRNIAVHIVSGDQQKAVETVASQVGITNIAAQCTPTEKRDYVAGLMSEGKNVMFVGDGTNDAVAVTQADVGVQIASVLSASDVTRGAADVILLAGLEGIPFLLDISGVAFRRMVFNFGWSAVYNVLAILLASGAFVTVRIPPAYAGLGEIVSVLPVIFAASTMLMKRIKTDA